MLHQYKKHILNVKSLLKTHNIRVKMIKQPQNLHQAFMLLDAVMGICICASAFGLAFSFLYTLAPPKSLTTYTIYKQLFLAPTHTPTNISPDSQPHLVYEVLEQSYTSPSTLETLRFYIPNALR